MEGKSERGDEGEMERGGSGVIGGRGVREGDEACSLTMLVAASFSFVSKCLCMCVVVSVHVWLFSNGRG